MMSPTVQRTQHFTLLHDLSSDVVYCFSLFFEIFSSSVISLFGSGDLIIFFVSVLEVFFYYRKRSFIDSER